MAMMVSHMLPWPLRQCLSRQRGSAFIDVQQGPPGSVPLTLHLWCFSSFCSTHLLQFSLFHAHILNQGISFLVQKPERKSGNISWLVLQDQQSITVLPKPNQTTTSSNNPNLSPTNPKEDKGATFQYHPKSEMDQHFFMSLAISLLLCSTSISIKQSLNNFDHAKHLHSGMAPLSNIWNNQKGLYGNRTLQGSY